MPVFLRLDGIPGDSTNAQHKDEIDIVAWTFNRPGTLTNATASSSPPKQPAGGHFTTRFDKKLFGAMRLHEAGGVLISKGVLILEFHRDGKLQSSQKYTFQNVRVESYSHLSGAGQDEPLVQYALGWTEMKRM